MKDTNSDPASIALLDAVEIQFQNRPEPAVLLGIGAELFFENGSTIDTRTLAFKLLADYAERYQDQLTHCQLPAIHPRITPYAPTTFRTEGQAAIAGFASDVHCAAAVLGAPFASDSGGLGHFSATFKSNGPTQLRPIDISHFSYAISGSRACADNLDTFTNDFVKAAEGLRILHGFAGPSVIFERIHTTSHAHALSFPLLKRFPGLHCARDAE